MCRLLAYVAREATSPLAVLGDQLPAFVALSRHHSDGWGLAWYDSSNDANAPRLTKAPDAAHSSATFAEATADIHANALIAHLRWATPGMALCNANTHPFTSGPFAFAHNGALEPLDAVESLIAPHLRATLSGATDSERYFLTLVSALERLDPIEAISTTLMALHSSVHTSSLNALLLTPTTLYAIADYDPQSPMAQQEPEYYKLSFNTSEHAVLVGSSGWQQGDGWQEIPNGMALVVDLGSLQTELTQVIDRADTATATDMNSTTEKEEQTTWQASLQR